MKSIIFLGALILSFAFATWATAGLESTILQQAQVNTQFQKVKATQVAVKTETAVTKVTRTATYTPTPGTKATASPSPTMTLTLTPVVKP